MKTSASGSVLLLFFLSLIASTVFSQDDYTVIKVYGTITYRKDNHELRQGDKLKEKEALIFKTNDAKAAVIHPDKGRLILTGTCPTPKDASNMNYVPGLSNISSKSIDFSMEYDLENEFSGNFLILNLVKVKFYKTQYKQTNDSFFFIKYTVNDQEITKKLLCSGDSLIIDASELQIVDDKHLKLGEITKMKIYYNAGRSYSVIGDFSVVLPEMENLKKEISIIIDAIKNKDNKFVFAQIKAYLTDFYGKPNDYDLKNWLRLNFQL